MLDSDPLFLRRILNARLPDSRISAKCVLVIYLRLTGGIGSLILILGLGVSVMFGCLSSQLEARPLLNHREFPVEKDDLLEIQHAVQAHLERVRKATVCVELGDGQGSGSAVIISKDGLIMTAAHVSTGVGREMKVLMEDGTEHKVVSLGLNSDSDAALMQIVGEGEYPYVELERESSTELGDWVFALGHSGGFDQDRGSVVRLGRVIRLEDTTLQSDCKLIGGDSGGPLFNLDGVLVGIHSRVGAELEGNMHVPMGDFMTHWEKMQDGEFLGDGPFAEKPVKGSAFMGLLLEEVEGGLRIVEFSDDSVVKEAGAMDGDILINISEVAVSTIEAIEEFMTERSAGDWVDLTLLRDDEVVELRVMLGKR